MKAFAIIETNVIAYPTVTEAKQAVAAAGDSEPRLAVASESELTNSPLSVGQLVAIWNGFAGVVPFDDLKPVKKFTDRKTAVARTWRAIQRLAPAPAETAPAGEPGAQGAPEEPKAAREASPKKRAPTAKKRAKRIGKKAARAKRETARHEGSKKALVIELLRRPEGATIDQLVEATGWQPHSIRGFLSGTLGKKMGHKVTRLKRDDGASVYFLTE